MSGKVRRYAFVSKKYRVTGGLEKQGAQAAGVHGHQAYGTFGARSTLARRRLGQALAAPTRGRCLTTLLALRAGDLDPAIKLPAETLD
eukprot:1556218-Pyramimonas_sp.AAC.1